MISELLAIISDAKYASDFDSVNAAISTLGDIRATEAIGVLVSHIGFPEVGVVDDDDTIPPTASERISPLGFASIERRLPAVSALINIGEPCIDAVIERIASAQSDTERRACAAVLRRLDRLPVRTRIEQAMQAAPREKREALQAALKLLDERPLTVEELREKVNKFLREHQPPP